MQDDKEISPVVVNGPHVQQLESTGIHLDEDTVAVAQVPEVVEGPLEDGPVVVPFDPIEAVQEQAREVDVVDPKAWDDLGLLMHKAHRCHVGNV